MTVNLRNDQKVIDINMVYLNKVTKDLVRILGYSDEKVNIVILDNESISALNKKYLDKKGPTDVLAFSMKEGKEDFVTNNEVLGDIAVSAEMAKQRSNELEVDFQKELLLYIIHGVLHLIGYEDNKPSSKSKMKEKEKELLSQLEM